MRNNEIDDELLEREPPPADPVTAMLDRLDSTADFGAPDEAPPTSPSLSRRDLDELVDQILDEELQRLNGRKG